MVKVEWLVVEMLELEDLMVELRHVQDQLDLLLDRAQCHHLLLHLELEELEDFLASIQDCLGLCTIHGQH